jgi:hypothetical protein
VADSAGRSARPLDTKALGKELQKQGEDLFKGFFGGKKKPAPVATPASAPTPAPAPAPTPAPADTARR